jgi:hypothetical protein
MPDGLKYRIVLRLGTTAVGDGAAVIGQGRLSCLPGSTRRW